MTTDSAFVGGGVYVETDHWGTITLSYGGEGAPAVCLNKHAIENLLVYLKAKPLTSIEELKRIRE